MQGKQPYDAPRVHVRALARLQQLHEEIALIGFRGFT